VKISTELIFPDLDLELFHIKSQYIILCLRKLTYRVWSSWFSSPLVTLRVAYLLAAGLIHCTSSPSVVVPAWPHFPLL